MWKGRATGSVAPSLGRLMIAVTSVVRARCQAADFQTTTKIRNEVRILSRSHHRSARKVERNVVDTPRCSGWEMPGQDVRSRARFDFVPSRPAPRTSSKCGVLDRPIS